MMKTFLSMAYIACLLSVGQMAYGELLDVGSTVPPYTLKDQHEQEHTLSEETRTLIVSADMKLSKAFHKWLSEKETDYMEQHHAEYVSDITGMPGIITFLFAMPKMKKYPFRILFSDDGSFEDIYPRQEKKITVFTLGPRHVIEGIRYVDKIEELEAAIERAD